MFRCRTEISDFVRYHLLVYSGQHTHQFRQHFFSAHFQQTFFVRFLWRQTDFVFIYFFYHLPPPPPGI